MLTVPSIVAAQQNLFQTNATKSVGFRIEQLKRLKGLLRTHESSLNRAIHADFGKSDFEIFATEIGLLHVEIDEAVAKLHKWCKAKRVRTNLLNLPARSFIMPEPLGSVLVIGAWNYPYQLSLAPAIAAIAAGNTVVLKPSEIPANTSQLIAELVNTHFDPAFFHVVEGGVAETQQLLEERWDKIFFTGSVPVGKIVYQAAAKNLTPVTLELGGKSPVFVTRDSNIEVAARRLVWGKFLNAGQTCIAPDYVLVADAVEEKLIAALKARIEAMRYSCENGNYVRIINEQNMRRLVALLDEPKVCHGGRFDFDERHIEPTLMRGVTFEDAVMKDEIFGPILPIIRYSALDEAIHEVKQRAKPLACYIFTNDPKEKSKILNQLSFGGGMINDTVLYVTNSHLPFGGVGTSGTGSYHGEAGFRTFTHYKSIMHTPTWLDPSIRYPPYSATKLKCVRWLFGNN